MKNMQIFWTRLEEHTTVKVIMGKHFNIISNP